MGAAEPKEECGLSRLSTRVPVTEHCLLKLIYSELPCCWAPRFSQDSCLSFQGLTYYLSVCQCLMPRPERRDSVHRHWPRQSSVESLCCGVASPRLVATVSPSPSSPSPAPPSLPGGESAGAPSACPPSPAAAAPGSEGLGLRIRHPLDGGCCFSLIRGPFDFLEAARFPSMQIGKLAHAGFLEENKMV